MEVISLGAYVIYNLYELVMDTSKVWNIFLEMDLNDWLIIKQAICQSIAQVRHCHFIYANMFMIYLFFKLFILFWCTSLLVDYECLYFLRYWDCIYSMCFHYNCFWSLQILNCVK
jgi:hypothetical protein